MQAAFALRDANQLPLHLCLAASLAGGVLGGVASWVVWLALGHLFWLPFWRQLRNYGMNADDLGWAMGVTFVPSVIGMAFLTSTLLSLMIVRWIGHPKLVIILVNLLPGLILTMIGLNGIFQGRYWEHPGFEIACLLIGFGWGAALYALIARRSAFLVG